MISETLLIKSIPFLILGALETLKIASAALAAGFCGGTLLGIFNSKKMTNPFFGWVVNAFIWIVRGTPLFVQLLIIYYALPELLGFSLSPFIAGVIALGLNSTAYISEIVRGAIDGIPEGQWEAAHVLGLSSGETLRGIILPQALRLALPSLTNELTTLIKETSILMVIGVAELTKVSKEIVARELDPLTIYLAAALLYLIMTSSISLIFQKWSKQAC